MRNSIPTRSRQIVAIASIACVLLGFAPVKVVRAQTSGTLRGQVFDDAGHPLPGVRITITNVESGNAVSVQTDENGNYLRTFLFPGSYRVTASKEGFTDGGVDIRVPLNNTTEIKPPDITIRPATTSTATQPPVAPATTTQQAPTPASEGDSSILINKSDATRGGNFTSLQLWTLPLGGGNTMRSFDELAFLLPGVAPPPYTPGVRGPGVGFGIGTAGQFSVNGMRARSNNFNVDGSDDNDPDVGVRRQGFVALVPQPIESIQEFQISTLLWNAEFGRNFGSQVNAVSRAGGKGIHGQAYGFFTHNNLNARNAFDSVDGNDPLTRTQAGFIIGGPTGHSNRTMLFGSYEFLSINSSTEQHFASPTAAERGFPGADEILLPVRLSDGSFPGTISFPGASPLGLNVFSAYPLPNNPGGPFGVNTYTALLPADGNGSVFSLRLTRQVTTGNTLNTRYNYTDDNRTLPSVNRAIRSTTISRSGTQNLSLIFDSALGANLFNQARFSFGRTRLNFSEYPGNPLLFTQDSPGIFKIGGQRFQVPSTTGPLGELVIEPFSPVGVDVFTFPAKRANNTFQYADTMSWNVLTHIVKFGTDIRQSQFNSRQDRNYRPLVVFGNGVFVNGTGSVSDGKLFFTPGSTLFLAPGPGLASLGIPSSIFQSITNGNPNSFISLRSTELNFFINDNWRITRKVTLDFGVRYEYNTVPHEAKNRIEDAITLSNLPKIGDSRFNLQSRTDAFNNAVNAYKQILAGRKGIYDPDKNNFAPHFGFAWAPDPSTAIRGGYGIYYDAILGGVVSQARNVFPNEIPFNLDPTFAGFSPFGLINPAVLRLSPNPGSKPDTPIFLIKPGTTNQFGGAPEDFVPGIGQLFLQNGVGGLAFTLPAKELRTPYAQQWHLTIEREVLRDYMVSAAYVGTKATKLTRLTTPNLGPNVIPFAFLGQAFSSTPLLVAGGSFFDGVLNDPNRVRPNPNLGSYQVFENSASSNYHALQLEARKRYNHGYTFTAAYTWSHAIDDVSDVFPIAGAPVLPQDSRNLRLERGDSNFDVRHRFSASLIWDLPFYRGLTGRAANALGGWQIAGLFQAHTGQPFTLNVPFDANLDGNLTDRPSNTSGLIFRDGHGSSRVQLPAGMSFLNFINTTGSFNTTTGVQIQPGTGFVGRNTVRADGFMNLDMALAKNFRLSESRRLEFRTEAFNVLNRANYGVPVRVIGAPGFGSSYDTVNPARIIQFALKYSF
jgi:carboxypeptidase family protein